MRPYFSCLIVALFISMGIAPQICAGQVAAWTKQFESTFSVSSKVGSLSFMYPKQFEQSETTMGVFLEADGIFGRIDAGATGVRTKEAATELLVTKQGGKSISESAVNGHTVFASTSMQGEQICRTYIVIPKGGDDDPLYIQFRWKAENPVDYTHMLDGIVATVK